MNSRMRKRLRKVLIALMIVAIVMPSFHTLVPSKVVHAEEDHEVPTIQVEVVPNPDDSVEDMEEPTSNESVIPHEEKVEESEIILDKEEEPESTPEKEEVKEEKELETSSEEESPSSLNEEKSTDSTEVEEAPTAEVDFNSYPTLLITEISPNSAGAGTDYFEYFELYNNSNQQINTSNLSFYYTYTDSGNELLFQVPEVVLESQETMVFWFNNGDKELEEFNSNFGLSLNVDQVVDFKDVFPGFANGGNRALVIKNKQARVLVSASYLGNETDNTGAGIEYKYPEIGTDMEKHKVLALPTPGTLDPVQVPKEPVKVEEIEVPEMDELAPVISHTPVSESTRLSPVSIEATITDNVQVVGANLYYKNEPDAAYSSIPMSGNGENYSAVIPGTAVLSTITYYIEATDGVNNATTETFSIEVEVPEETYSELPLLITELSPNSVGAGTDYYEFFEIYNNTNQALNLANYSFIYKYTDTGNELPFRVPAVVVEPQETLVFWFNNGNRTLVEFNENFQLDLSREQVVEYTDVFPGFANGGNRALVIKDGQGEEVVSASYLVNESDNNGLGIDYIFPASGTEMDKLQVLAAPTPGTVEEIQVPTNPVLLDEIPEDNEAPVIEHTPVTASQSYSPILIEATITDNMAAPFATLFYKKIGDETFTSLAMSQRSNGSSSYVAEIPGVKVDATLVYYLEASDGHNVTKTNEYTIEVEQTEVDYQALPPFLVTEVVPDSTNVGTADGYEFIEIYNNTNQAINFKDYKIQYRYGSDRATDVIWASVPDDVVIPSKGTLVFWIINSQNGAQTVADFNANYGTNLVENKDIVRIYSDGMANAAMRGLVVATNSKKELAVAYYNDVPSVIDAAPDKAILYKYPLDGSTQMLKISAKEKAATPGTVEPDQVPLETVQLPVDNIPPTYENLTAISEVDQNENIHIVLDAEDDKEVKTVRLLYRTNDQTDFTQAILAKDYNDLLYHHTIYSPDIIAKEYVEYYFQISDGTNEVTSETYQIQVTSELDFSSLRLNVKEGEILTGETIIKGTSKEDNPDDVKLFIDNQEVLGEVFSSVEHTAYFAFEVSGINTFFQNGVTMGDNILHIFDDWIAEWQTITVPIDPDRLELGDNIITIRSGNKASPFDLDSPDNRDDYNLRNVRLVLADGTVLRDPVKNNPSQVFDMGDDGTYRIFEDFTFTIENEHAPSKSYKWDTTTVNDGDHVIKVQDSDEEIQVNVQVDNTIPVITTSLVEGKEYKGSFTIDANATDEIAGIKNIQIHLDEKEISVPYATSSSKLAAGEHQLKVVAIDQVGNEAVEIVHFSVVNENPYKPELISPADDLNNAVDGDPNLQVRVTDPTEDELDVTFYGGFQYDASQTDKVNGYKNANDVEPPQTMVPEGETAFTEEEIDLVSKEDGQYLVTDATTQFPYHRFDVTVDSSIAENDLVELVWKGNSLEGRKVTMYAWNHTTSKWAIVDYRIAGTEDFELKGNVEVKDFIKDESINVLVQDEIPSSSEEYDYTFVWMSDTQYYAESYPYIFDRQTQWIAEMQEEMKIKYVFHTGDIVNVANQEYQWINADRSMRVLDEKNIPYGVLAGNHDVDHKTNDYTEYYKYFGEDRFSDKPYYGGSYENNRGHYDLISANGNDYIMVYLGWGVEEEGIAWMNEVLAAHPDRMAILSFHEYLQATGVRHPLGDKLYNEVVLPNKNVVAVLSGHYHESQLLVDEIDDDGDGIPDRQVFQMLADYQAGPEGGQGYMRLLHFDTANNRILVNTYSPYLDKYNYYDSGTYPEKDEFIINLDLEPKVKRVATDYFTVNVYTEMEIGKVENVLSGDIVDYTWEGLVEGNSYWWYVVAEDQHTGRTVSDIWSFRKGANPEIPNIPDPENPTDPTDPTNPIDPDEPEQPTNPVDPSNPEQPDPSIPDSEDQTPVIPDKPEKEDNKQPTDQEPGGKLPNTGTNVYNLFVIGITLLILGTAYFYYHRRKLQFN
ncbi:lamin tail domain-containing protein [Sutcliffiella halmapala]|uniref:lamin tail domain-containing protein n=1 Tax=Sutcliffiella halmapala TaxID=79882 RepID=UPI0009952EBE|nr:lamin tail domain-containing protein [Sutcliffiella halmapala]